MPQAHEDHTRARSRLCRPGAVPLASVRRLETRGAPAIQSGRGNDPNDISEDRSGMDLELVPATPDQAAEIAALQTAVAADLTERFGTGPWSAAVSERMALFHQRTGVVYVARQGGQLIATLRLCTKKPWAIDRTYFTAVKKPLYLHDMAVAPAWQRRGVGTTCLDRARRIAVGWPADAIRLDAFDAPAGAGDFYRKCGFREVGRVTYRKVPLVYFEAVLREG